jgi:enoyl-CoA hydratase/carnithine racemase
MAMCDLAVAHTGARFALPEVKVGVFPAQVIAVLRQLLPRRVLNHMCLTGEPISASQALELNLVNAIGEDVDVVLDDLLRQLRAASPAAMRRGLYMLNRIESMPFEEAISFAEGQIALLALTDDAKEGVAAFAEKRTPLWTGR